MAAANFGSTIFSKYYTINSDNDLDFDFMKEDLAGVISSLEGACMADHKPYQIAKIWREIELCGICFEMEIEVFLRPGYYTGAYLDGALYIDGSEYNSINDIDFAGLMEDGLWATDQACQYHSEGSIIGFSKIQGKNLAKKMRKVYSEILSTIENAVTPITENYICLGYFSNGEAFYKKIA